MPESELCHSFSKDALKTFNQARVSALFESADALIAANRLTLTDIGRNLKGKADVKHKIKRVDRLLGNEKLGTHQTWVTNNSETSEEKSFIFEIISRLKPFSKI